MKCKKSRDKQKVHQYYTINCLISLRLEVSGQAEVITHVVDLQKLFPISKLMVRSFFFDICW